MSVLPSIVRTVIDEFSKLPGVGPKSSARMAYHYLRGTQDDATRLAQALLQMEKEIVFCEKCFNVSESDVCSICSSKLRDHGQICIVAKPLDVVAFEEAGIYDGLYFVLGGVISPADGIGAEELRFKQLKKRVKELMAGDVSGENNEGQSDGADGKGAKKSARLEVIVATSPNLEGEATASYVQDCLSGFVADGDVLISRLAMGLPTGADVEYADRLTLKRSLEGRTISN